MDKQKLIEAGIDYDEGVHRFANNNALYERFLLKLFDDPTFEQMQQQIAAGQYEDAFRSAHTLKGLSSNLSANEFYHAICLIVEQLRSGQPDDSLPALIEDARAKYARAEQAAKG